MSDVAFVFSKKAHGASGTFAKSLDADFYPVSRFSLQKIFTIPKHKYYFVESIFALSYPVLKKKLLRQKSKIIFRCNSNLFSDERGRYFQGNFFTRRYIRFLLKNTDGIIAVSKMVQNDARKKTREEIGREIATKVSYSFVSDHKKWLSVKPDIKSKNFLHIGYIRHHKALDITLKAFGLINKEYPESVLFLAGISEDDLKRYGLQKIRGVYPLGFTSAIEQYAGKCAFYLATPRYEPGPTASVEAMAAGLVPIVNHRTGHQDHVEQLDKDLIIKSLDPEQVAKQVLEIMGRKDLKKLSDKSRKIALHYTKDKMIGDFKKTFYEF